jgi:DnaJ-class molecular chaperone
MDLKTSLDLLGLGPQADEAQAKRAYKAQVRRWHPDQFPAAAARTEAEERLKLINIAYTHVKAYLARHRPAADAPADAGPTHPHHDAAAAHQGTSGEKTAKRSWVDQLFEALHQFRGNRDEEPPATPSVQNAATRRKSFDQVLDEMTGGTISPQRKGKERHPAAARQRHAAGYGQRRRGGTSVGAVGGTERTGPIKPVGRVRGIGRPR